MNPFAPSPVSIEYADDDFVLGSFGPCPVGYWRGVVALENAARMFDFAEGLIAKSRRPLVTFVVVGVPAVAPNGPLRQFLAERTDHLLEISAGLATIVDGHGLRVAFVRSVQTGLNMITGNRPALIKQRTFGSGAEAERWVQTLDAAQLPPGFDDALELFRHAPNSAGLRVG